MDARNYCGASRRNASSSNSSSYSVFRLKKNLVKTKTNVKLSSDYKSWFTRDSQKSNNCVNWSHYGRRCFTKYDNVVIILKVDFASHNTSTSYRLTNMIIKMTTTCLSKALHGMAADANTIDWLNNFKGKLTQHFNSSSIWMPRPSLKRKL